MVTFNVLILHHFHQVAANQSQYRPPKQQLRSGHGLLADMRSLESSTRGRQSTGKVYRYSDGTWRVSPWIGSSPSIKSVGTAECPTRVSQWQYSDFTLSGSVWYSGAITAQCS